MNTEQRIQLLEQRIRAQINPHSLNIIDDSHSHRGHAGNQHGAGYFTIEVSADSFNNKTRVQCHRMIYEAVGDLMEAEIHALAIKII